ncbi:MAG: hypothetical protein QG637_283, partial [Chloroflexota bacterium]|nr:hypothetical protein [Chloroflexota bacterium]
WRGRRRGPKRGQPGERQAHDSSKNYA